MYFFPQHGLGFFHIPKTGGTSMSTFLIDRLGQRGDQAQEITLGLYHEPLQQKMQLLGEEQFRRTTILTTIRNPYAVVVSLYFWSRHKAKANHADLAIYPQTQVVAAMDFDTYVDWFIANEYSFEHYLLVDGRVPSNVRVLKLENIAADADRVLNDELGLGLQIDIPTLRATSHDPFMTYLSRAAIEAINRKFEWVFDEFYPETRAAAASGKGSTGA